MNTTVSTTPGRHERPHQPVTVERFVHTETHEAPAVVRSVHLLDRIALHVGIALIKWGRRRAAESRERLAQRHEQRIARLARERHDERRLRLEIPPR